MSVPEPCPRCRDVANVRPKLVLIDEAWVDEPGKDPRLAYVASLRVDDVKPENVRASPLEQFVDGWFCDRCGRAFVAEETAQAIRRKYWR